MGDQPNDQAATPEASDTPELVADETLVDPFEEDWDDAEMNERFKEWQRLLADTAQDDAASLERSVALPPETMGEGSE